MFGGLKYEDGLITSSMTSATPVTYQDAVLGIQEATMVLLTEAQEPKENFFERAKKTIQKIIEKVVGFFRYWIARIRGFKNEKTKKVMDNRAKILAFDNEQIEVKIPGKLMSPTGGVTPEKTFSSLKTYFVSIKILKGTGGFNRHWKGLGDADVDFKGISSTIQGLLYRTILGDSPSGEDPANFIFSHLYGEDKMVLLMDNRNKLMNQFLAMDKGLDKLNSLSSDVNGRLQKAMTEIKQLNDQSNEVKYRALQDFSHTCQAIIIVTQNFLTAFTRAYNLMYQTLMKMAN